MSLNESKILNYEDIKYGSGLMLDCLLERKEIRIILINIYKNIHNQEFNLFLLIFY